MPLRRLLPNFLKGLIFIAILPYFLNSQSVDKLLQENTVAGKNRNDISEVQHISDVRAYEFKE